MKNVTISLDEETADWARVEAARRDTSVSKLVGELLHDRMVASIRYETARRSFASRGATDLSSGVDRYPARDELYER